MKTSFVIPVFKKPEDQFNRAVKSLLTMSEKNIEVIAVFDGPDADLQPHADKWAKKDKRFKTIAIEHGGACKARNAGTAIATGDLVAAWDADCYAEPEMLMMWLKTFKDNPDCDFVYSGYKFTSPDVPGFDSEPFDPWTLSKYNYIASMFPVKREKLVKWDEDLDGLQDWDFWRRISENGSKGRFIPGYGFWTELPNKDSISGQSDKRVERIRKVKEKHSDIPAKILVHGTTMRRQAISIAKTLGADYFNGPFWRTEEYKMVLTMGLHPWELTETSGVFKSCPPETSKAIYWSGYDADNFAMAPYVQVRGLMEAINKEIDYNFTMDDRVKTLLDDLGVKKTEALVFPREPGEPAKTLPETFKVLAWSDEAHRLKLQGVAQALPDISFEMVKDDVAYNLKDYSVVLQFTNAQKLEDSTRNALMMGRYVISNIQEPYAGYIDDTGDVTTFKNEIIQKLRELEGVKEVNAKAQEYYLQESDPQKFKDRIDACLLPVLTVVA